jgi:ankyrin repeat protein
MNILKDLPTKGDIKEALQNLAKGAYTLNEIYEQAMERIEDQRKHSRELAKQILAWIIYAQRPLSTGELQHALAVKKDTTKLNSDYLPSIKILRSICAGLVTVDEESGIIRLVHYTTQEYFNKNPTKWFLNAEAEITTTCIIYLSFSVFQSGICQTDNEFEERLQSYQLYDYASRYWGHHARKASILCDSVIKFLRKQAQIEASSQALMAVKRWPGHTGYSQEIPRQMTGLHLAAYFGLDNAVQVLGSNSPDQKDSYRRTPLSYAAKGGHEEVVKLLLATGQVDINTKDEDGWTPLSRAAWEGYKEVVNLLFITGQVDINAKDKYGWTLLSRAAWEGHEEAVKLLLATGQVDFNIKDKYGRTPLSRAAERGHEEVVKLLLATGQVDANAKDNDGETPLWRAANEGHEKVVKLLLATGQVDINAKDEYSETLLWRAANEGQEEVVKLLLATGQVDINAKDEYGRTPLSRAIEKGYKGIIKLLNCTI